MTEELSGRRIVVPETRELGQLVRMLEGRGADTVPCPMIAIRDAPDPEPVEAWLRRFAKGACDDLVLMTGEGLRRLLGFARRIDLESAFIVALRLARKITRGPKPVRALREIGLAADMPADEASFSWLSHAKLECPLWVKTGRDHDERECPLCARSGHANFAMDVAACASTRCGGVLLRCRKFAAATT
jgi:Uroporphyrinogen-III synthase HemD